VDGGIMLLLLAGAAWWLHKTLFPFVHGLADKIIRGLIRAVVTVGWTMPKRHFGIGLTLWLWGVALAVLITLISLGLVVQIGPLGVLPAVVSWVLVVAGWRYLRWRARHRYTPRPLPRRQRGRR
jgi:hypothetical protein